MPARDLAPYLGRPVQVVIDRPLGSHHPRHPEITYPVNYGYLPDTISGDGAPIDAYVLGVDTPVATFQGVVIAVVIRADDVEDKLVVAPSGTSFSRQEIATAVAFQEQFFTSRVVITGDTHMPHPRNPDDIEIVVATPDDWQAARDIRMEGLLRDPQAFGATYAEAVERTEAGWRDWLNRPGLTLLLARTAEGPVGIVGGLRSDAAADASLVWVVSMYVSADRRGHGVGRHLLQTLLDDLARDATLTRARLNVASSQLAAQRLYTSLGFVPVGEEEDEIIMERPLR